MRENIYDIGRALFILAMFASGCITGGLLQRLRMINRMKQCERIMLTSNRKANKARKDAQSWESMAKTMEYKVRTVMTYAEQLEVELSNTEGDLAAERLSNRIVWPKLLTFERN